MKVLAFDPNVKNEVFEEHQITRFNCLEEMLPKLDILSIHASLNDNNYQMIGTKEISSKMIA